MISSCESYAVGVDSDGNLLFCGSNAQKVFITIDTGIFFKRVIGLCVCIS